MSNPARLVLVAALASFTLLLAVVEADAWTCTARSRYASGWGSSWSLAQAKRIALTECAVRTPRGRMCRLTSCR